MPKTLQGLQDCCFDALPNELLARVGEKLMGMDLVNALLTSREWYSGIRSGIKKARLCIPHRRSVNWEKEINGIASLPIRDLKVYGLLPPQKYQFRGTHRNVRAVPDISRDLEIIVRKLKLLKSMELENVQVTSNQLIMFKRCKSLVHMTLSGCIIVDPKESESVVLHELGCLKSLAIRNVDWFVKMPCMHHAHGLHPLALKFTFPINIVELDLIGCVMQSDVMLAIPENLKQTLKKLRCTLPLDLGAVGYWRHLGSDWMVSFLNRHLGGFQSLTWLTLVLVPSITGDDQTASVDSHLEENPFALLDLESLSVIWSNSLLHFACKDYEIADTIQELLVVLLRSSPDLVDIHTNIPLTKKAGQVFREILGRRSLRTIRMETCCGDVVSLLEYNEDCAQLCSLLSKQTDLRTLSVCGDSLCSHNCYYQHPGFLDIIGIVSAMKNLESLDLRNWNLMHIQENGHASIPKLPKSLKVLHVDCCSELIARQSENLQNLRTLRMSNSCLSLEELTRMGRLRHLECLELMDTSLSEMPSRGSTCHGFDLFPSLQSLSIESTFYPLMKVMFALGPATLSHLRVCGPAEISDELRAFIATSLQLVSLDLSNNIWINETFLRGFPVLPNLRTLDVSSCTRVTAGLLKSVFGWKNLRKITISTAFGQISLCEDGYDLEKEFPRCDIQDYQLHQPLSCWWW